jgi:cellulose synthase operon protein C
MALAGLQLRQGAPLQEVRDTLAAGIKAAPSEAGPRLQLIELLIAKKQFKEALAVAQEATAALPNDASLMDALGRAQMLAGDTQQAISTLRKFASVETKSARPHLLMADLMVSTGNREGAVSSLRRALEAEPANEAAQVRLMDMLSTDGRPKDALQMARDMQLHNPKSATGYLLEGAIQRRIKALGPAVDAYRNGIKQALERSALAVELHKTLIADGRAPEAERFATTWTKEHANDIGFEYHLATMAILRRDFDRAETLLTHVISLRPDMALALNNLAWVLASRGKPGAIAYAQKATELLPNRPPLMDTLAMALAADKQLPKALEMQKKAIEIAPGDMGLRLNLAKIAIQAGDKTLARTELERLAAQGSKLAYQAEVQRLLKTL